MSMVYDDSTEFTRCAARVALATRELERIAERSGLSVATAAVANLRDARVMLDELLERAPAPETDAEQQPKAKLADAICRCKKSRGKASDHGPPPTRG